MRLRLFLHLIFLPAFVSTTFTACDSGEPESEPEAEASENCIISTDEFANSTGIDAIPALTNPKLLSAEEAQYLKGNDLVFGLRNGDLTLAIPHNILWWHEIINLDNTSPQLAVTFCPLTGSGIAFDRAPVGNLEFGVSGLLWRNNNVLFDRSTDASSLWSQMGSVALCNFEGEAGKRLPPYPIVEMTWDGWKALHPETLVVSDNTGFNRNYEINPLGSYINPDNSTLLWPMPGLTDTRRPPKERVLGLPDETGGLTFPFDELDKLGSVAALHSVFKGKPVVILYEREKRAAWAFWLTGENLDRTFEIVEGTIQDKATGSIWQVDGLAIEGALSGTQLTPIAEAYVSYWFAWSVFQPTAELWRADG